MNEHESTPHGMTNSHILLHRFDYYEPATLDEAIGLLVQYHGRAKILAGGTDLLVQMKMERTAPQAVISIGRIPGLDQITEQEDGLHIGARASIRAIERYQGSGIRDQESGCPEGGEQRSEARSQRVARYAALAEACASFSTAQVQTMGTIGGNLGNGSPASDSAPALIAHRAEVILAGPAGTRRLPLEQFFLGPGKAVLQADELITEVVLPARSVGVSRSGGSAFRKIGRVAADIAKASAAVEIVRDGARVVDCRMAFGSVAPTPLRTRNAEQALIGQVWDPALVERAAALAASEVSPIDDVRSTAAYRRDVVAALAYDALHAAWQRAGGQVTPAGDERRRTEDEGRKTPAGNAPVVRHSSFVRQESQGAGGFGKLSAGERRWIVLRVNGREHQAWVGANDLLLNVLREQLQLTGTKYGCGIGECSACTVLMDGAPVLACLVLAVSAVGHEIVTVEGLAGPDGGLDPLQDAFIEYAAYQCGYCTPGMLLTAKSLLTDSESANRRISEEDVRHYLRGNLCRCTGYASIVRAVLAAAERISE